MSCMCVCIDLASILALNSHCVEWTLICVPVCHSVITYISAMMMDITEPLAILGVTSWKCGIVPSWCVVPKIVTNLSSAENWTASVSWTWKIPYKTFCGFQTLDLTQQTSNGIEWGNLGCTDKREREPVVCSTQPSTLSPIVTTSCWHCYLLMAGKW